MREAPFEDFEVQKGRILEHRERPFVGIGDKRDALVLDHSSAGINDVAREMGVEINRMRRDQQPFLLKFLEQGGCRKTFPIFQGVVSNGTEHPPIHLKDEASRVSERPRIPIGACLVWFHTPCCSKGCAIPARIGIVLVAHCVQWETGGLAAKLKLLPFVVFPEAEQLENLLFEESEKDKKPGNAAQEQLKQHTPRARIYIRERE